MKNAFTMIELIFIITIVGILATIALPKLSATRDEASATTCIHEVTQLVNELSTQYTKRGNNAFMNMELQHLTNVELGVTVYSGLANAPTDTISSSTDELHYLCDGMRSVKFTWDALDSEILIESTANDYNITDDPTNLAQIIKQRLAGSLLNTDGSSRIYAF
ncbi:MAG: type II secretion system protein [Campylobacterota bacterium]|nr:type II secretion system protein [Campylobacterota bacterium]